MDIPELRRRLRAAMEHARREAAARRERSDAAAREYEQFLTGRAVPAVQALASALSGEGFRFGVASPAGSVRLSAERSAEDFIELELDSSVDPPAVIGRSSRGRGRRAVTSERQIGRGTGIAGLTEEDVLEYLLEEIVPFVER